jgi:hypothetical protein
MSGGSNNPHTQEHTMYLPIITPTARFLTESFIILRGDAIAEQTEAQRQEGYDDEQVSLRMSTIKAIQTHPHGGTVMVKLDESEVLDILDGNRHASWICDLRTTLEGLVEDGHINPTRTWTVTGKYYATYKFEVEVEAPNEEMAIEEAREEVELDPGNHAWDDEFRFQDVSAERG